MSLKAFHVFFILVATIFTIGFGVWGIRSYMHTGEMSHLLLGSFSLIGSVFLAWYFKWFLKKLKDVSYL